MSPWGCWVKPLVWNLTNSATHKRLRTPCSTSNFETFPWYRSLIRLFVTHYFLWCNCLAIHVICHLCIYSFETKWQQGRPSSSDVVFPVCTAALPEELWTECTQRVLRLLGSSPHLLKQIENTAYTVCGSTHENINSLVPMDKWFSYVVLLVAWWMWNRQHWSLLWCYQMVIIINNSIVVSSVIVHRYHTDLTHLIGINIRNLCATKYCRYTQPHIRRHWVRVCSDVQDRTRKCKD